MDDFLFEHVRLRCTEQTRVQLQNFRSQEIAIERMLATVTGIEGLDEGAIMKTKEKVYERILDLLIAEGYPSEEDPDFKESNVNDLALHIIVSIISDFVRMTGRKTTLVREKKIISVDGEAGGYEEFLVVDAISVNEDKYVLVVESKRSSLGVAIKQCLLSLKDMQDSNGGGAVYGVVTTGEDWQMLSYDGASFRVTRKAHVLFGGMDQDKELWMAEHSILVNCIYFAWANGGIVRQDVAVV